MRSDEQMPCTVTRAPVARVAARLDEVLGPGVGGEHHCRRLIDVERAIHHVETRTSASRVTPREIYPNWISPPRPGLSQTRRHRRSADRRRPSRRTAATLTRPEQAEPARAYPALEQRSQTSQCQPIEGALPPTKCDPKGQADAAGVLGAVR
jgi:hypothetical protein